MSYHGDIPAWKQGRGRGIRGSVGGRGRGNRLNDGKPQYEVIGRGGGDSKRANGGNQWQQTPRWGSSSNQHDVGSSQQRFEKVKESMKEAAEKFASQEDDDDYSDSDEETTIGNEVLNKTLQTYSQQIGSDDVSSVDRAKQFLSDCYTSSTTVCLICIAVIKNDNPVWSCSGCYCMFHLNCIQNWSKHGAMRKSLLSEENFPAIEQSWHCPKCRFEYKLSQCPTQYRCFCKRQADPTFDPWLVPHSCGQKCDQVLQPECGHACLLLCHPGPCPPCPITVRTSCHCGRQPAVVRRCSAKEWSCGQSCNKPLLCGQHYCQQPCHKGECAPCGKQSIQSCLCGKEQIQRPCSSPQWQCAQICNKPFACGFHVCDKHCHSGECGTCPRSGNRTCPCGKTSYEMPCTEDVPTCGDTCEKLLTCGLHYCTQRCHTGPCETCRQMVTKKCRCGARKKSVQCYKDYLCDTKCPKIRDCENHQCKRKCCDGNCPSCEQPCNRLLSCKNHKCPSKCHVGLCYPCPLMVDINCRCGSTTYAVPCGREKYTKPPRCKQPCKVPPDCHHAQRLPHPCHFGRCPPCFQVCGNALPNCQHLCEDSCHSAVLVKEVEQQVRSGPWEPKAQAKLSVKNFPCRPCRHLVQVVCMGKHQEFTIPCCEVRPLSCGRVCGRQLSCTNHVCQLECHVVTGAPDAQQHGVECESCELGCQIDRPAGCTHKCLDPCHPGPCKQCTQMFKKRCHCRVMLLYIDCWKWTQGDEESHQTLLCCQGQCHQVLACGHTCSKVCHSGDCSSTDMCTKKTMVRCPCQRKKKDFPCKMVQSGEAELECDDICQEELEKKKKAAKEAEEARKEEELKKQQAELAEYERHMKGRKKQRKRKREKEEVVTWWMKYGRYVTFAILIAILSVFTAYLIRVD
ncbi:NF-X1-type zinc finger protein NFXL1-like [Saccoglossus kowalevskii]|uniref:NF-X1-type zinc finger protein NFXL1-like n=1 Tax=Saccoglossus kowalevskii TaxID=10224 RepID=A0ABM0MFY9_SACKO|nr:PREDICTED: NF-X1-type zinc finger protein NFXL1-like [Saccoglossus kowalevskii]